MMDLIHSNMFNGLLQVLDHPFVTIKHIFICKFVLKHSLIPLFQVIFSFKLYISSILSYLTC